MTTFFDVHGRERKINNQADLKACIISSAVHGSKQKFNRAALWETFCEHYDGQPQAFENFIQFVADTMADHFTATSFFIVENYFEGDDAPEYMSWEEFKSVSRPYACLWDENHSLKAWLKLKCNGATYSQSRLTMAKIAAGEEYTFTYVPGKQTAIGEKQESARGKSGKGKADGAKLETPESGATILEKIAGDRDLASAALQAICDAFPGLIVEQSGRGGCIAAAIKKASAKQTRVTRARTKAQA